MSFRGFSPDELEREYSPSSMIGGDYSRYLQQYVSLSDDARRSFGARTDLRYGAKPSQVLDYFPGPGPSVPLHVFIHGGYWQALSQAESSAMAPAIVASGAAFASLNYTLAPAAHLGEMVAECRAALAWLAADAAGLGFDPTHVTVSGHSAGAHLAAMVAAEPGDLTTESGLTFDRFILISGIYDLTPIRMTSINEPLGLSEDDVEALSPMGKTPAVDAVMKVVVGERDTREFIRQSRDYATFLIGKGFETTFEIAKDRHHFDIILDPATFR